jgi:hypothetical protein
VPGTSGGGDDAFAVAGPAVGEGGTGADQITNIGIPGGRGGGAFSIIGTATGGKGGNGSKETNAGNNLITKVVNGVLGRFTSGGGGGRGASASARSVAAPAAVAARAAPLMPRMAIAGSGSALPLARSGAPEGPLRVVGPRGRPRVLVSASTHARSIR